MSVVSDINDRGISVLRRGFDRVDAFVEHLSRCPLYPNHVRQGKDPAPVGSHPWMCSDMHDAIRAPGWFEIALSMLPIARMLLGRPPLLYSINSFWCSPGVAPKPDIQDWHRDADDKEFIALFAYGTDIKDEADGPHQFVAGSHRGVDLGIETVFGKRGTMFLARTTGLHRGIVPRRAPRMLVWARYGVSNPPDAYFWDKLSPLPRAELGSRYPSDARIQEAIHLVVA